MKIFLCAPINVSNAQNINCKDILGIAEANGHEVRVLAFEDGNIELSAAERSRALGCRRPYRFTTPMAIARGFRWADCVYCPKPDFYLSALLMLSRIYKKPVFTTIETALNSGLDKAALSSLRGLCEAADVCFCITDHIYRGAAAIPGLKVHPHVLHLGVDGRLFGPYSRVRRDLRNVVFIGNDLERKGYIEFLSVAESLSEIGFVFIGDLSRCTDSELLARHLELEQKNLRSLGVLNRGQLAEALSDVDLLFLPSRVEGFPKVILEAAASGVPSIIYPDYGASDWMASDRDGFIVKDLHEAASLVRNLARNPARLETVSQGALELAKKFSWERVWSAWEAAIDTCMNISVGGVSSDRRNS